MLSIQIIRGSSLNNRGWVKYS